MGQSGMGQEENIEGQLDGEQDSRQKYVLLRFSVSCISFDSDFTFKFDIDNWEGL